MDIGYYKPTLEEWLGGMGAVVKPREETAQVETEEEADRLPIGTVFHAPAGWFIVVSQGEYRPWYWGSPLRAA
jgi:hypothetical protein